jgi:hypothetical protein
VEGSSGHGPRGIEARSGAWTPSRRFAALLATAAFAMLALGAAPASAAKTRLLEASFGPDGTAASSFEQPAALGVDQSTGDVYVADYAAGTVQKFNSAHEPSEFTGLNPSIVGGKLTGFSFFTTEPESQLAVNSTSHDFYVVNNGDKSVRAFQSDGEPADFTAGPGAGTNQIGGFGELCGVAVDANGDIYASDFFNGVQVYAPSGEPLTTISAFGTCNVAAASQGTVYLNHFEGRVEKLSPSEFPVTSSTTYESVGTVDENGSWGVAVDPASDHLYVDEHNRVAEYDEGGTRIGSFGAAGPGALTASEGLAVNAASGQIYVSDAGANRQVETFGPPVVLPDATTGEASEVQPTSVTLNGVVNPEGVEVTDCHFDYVDEADYNPSAANPYKAGGTAACEETVGSGTSEVSVKAKVTGLQVGTTYHYRLQTSNENGSEFGQDATFATPPPPSIDSATATNVTATSVDLNAQINPGGLDTTYHFEYGTTGSYGASIPILDEDIGEGTSDVAKSQHVTGLSANTTYHWRVVAKSAAGVTTGGDHTFVYPTTGGGLPDNRSYEMVTPPNKNAALIGDIIFGLFPDLSEDGSRLILSSIQCFAGAGSCQVNRGPVGTQYEFERTSGGWVTTPLAPPSTQFEANTIWQVSADVGAALFSAPTAPHGEDDLYVRRLDGSLAHIGPVTPPEDGALGPVGAQGGVKMATADFSHVVFNGGTVKEHWSFDKSKGSSVYEYVGTGNTAPVLVGVSGGSGSTDLISTCGTSLGAFIGNARPGTLSADGRTVFFTAGLCPEGGWGANVGVPVPAEELYARIGESETVKLSEHSSAECTGVCQSSSASDASFLGASVDGSKAFFTSTQQLTDSASEDSGDTALTGCISTTGANGCNLYEYDFANPVGRNLIAVSAGDTSGHGPRVQGVMAISSDGSHVYFVAKGVLSATANGQGQTAQDGAENLYVYERDASHPGGRTTFIATLSSSDSAEWHEGSVQEQEANVTPDGRFLVFGSGARLTPDDTSGTGATQVFRYDALTGALVRISIGENGFNDNGNTGGTATASIAGGGRFFEHAGPARRDPTMSHDGAYVFFMSPVGLTPQALNEVQILTLENGQPEYAQNVYEYHDGHVYLVSDGRDVSADPAAICGNFSAVCLVRSDASGANVFFTTADQLAPRDTDTQLDFYDARICTSSDPCVKPPLPPLLPCLGEACHGTPTATPLVPSTPSVTFNGTGNLTPPTHAVKSKKCKKGFARRRGRCVRARHAKKAKRSSRRSKGRAKR